MPAAKAILLFVKYPEPGSVKTRLARKVGAAQAAQIYRALVEINWKVLTSLPGDDVRIFVAFDPPHQKQAIETWLPQADHYFFQQGSDLGERLKHAFTYGLARADQVLVLGSDTLQLTHAILAEGLQALTNQDVVLGPARDGGYYLIGLKKACPVLFEDMLWSTPAVLATTLARIRREGLQYALLPELNDLDEAEDLIQKEI